MKTPFFKRSLAVLTSAAVLLCAVVPVQSSELFPPSSVRSYAQGFEAFYNIAFTPACHVTLDVQVVEPAGSNVDTATILGMRASLAF